MYYNTYSCSEDEATNEDSGLTLEKEKEIEERNYYWQANFFQELSYYYPSFDLHPPPESWIIKNLKRPQYMFNRCNPVYLFVHLLQGDSMWLLKKYLYEEKGFWTKATRNIMSKMTVTDISNLEDRVEYSNLELCDFDFLFYHAFKWNSYHDNYRKNDSTHCKLYVDCYVVSMFIVYLQKDKRLDLKAVLRRNRRNVRAKLSSSIQKNS